MKLIKTSSDNNYTLKDLTLGQLLSIYNTLSRAGQRGEATILGDEVRSFLEGKELKNLNPFDYKGEI